MRYILLLIFITGCANAIEQPSTKITKNTLTHKAYYYYGLNEQEDRMLIKDIMGIDPVHVEWCAAFVNMVLLENDLPQSNGKYPYLARNFLTWGSKVDTPQQGDVVVFKRGNSGWQGHVAFYVSTTIINDKEYYLVIGGNQSDEVNIEPYPVSNVLSIRRLNFQ